jgi:hypothetical protein
MMLSWVRDHLSEEAHRQGVVPGKLTFLKRIGGDLSPDGKALFEVLGPDSPVPLWIVKVARTARGNRNLWLEHQRLQHLSKIFSQPTAQGIDPHPQLRTPLPILFEERSNGSISVETFLTGNRVSQLLQQHNQPDPWIRWGEIVSLAMDGLSRYARSETRRQIEITKDWWRVQLLEPLTPHYEQLATLSVGWPRIWNALKETADWDYSGQTVPQHGDFTPANLVLEGKHIGVFDWSPDDVASPPLLDLFQFLASASLFLGQSVECKTKLTELRTCLMTDHRFLQMAAPHIAKYVMVCGLERKDLYPLSLASLGIKILTLIRRPVPSLESLSGWLWTTSEWIAEEGAKKLLSFAKEKDFA